MQFQTYLSILVAIAGVVSGAPTPVDGPASHEIETRENVRAVKKSAGGRFKPIWVIGHDEDAEGGAEHIGFRLFEAGEEGVGAHEKPHGFHGKTSDEEKSSFWYYY
ncbi:hypothetical protein F5X98DRAFT_344699 [Xylaria grammica]|nr:hypothetical protein F5X98DRAFT_344699 [Xylaria grammica]